MLRATVAAAVVASAAAFSPAPQMGLRGVAMQAESVSRREIVQAGAAAAALFTAAPVFAQPAPGIGYAQKKREVEMKNKNFAPVITVFDHRGCAEHVNKEYTGPKSNDENDEMLVKVKQTKLRRDDPKFVELADRIVQETKGTFYQYPIRDVGYSK
ncbi:phycoerythrin alpha subunit 13 [Guillardia theta CCMP2712]|uniref:Phycoerythrin alpha subunit 13 n=3 Tax=Guillardia theta TaxID=55529 RepID=L1J598_GUITC|nr:phycoerythrin alpha subunit 13 [Guillardia theta CCMP2712]EKX43260.1 phycoerythrin alpha subunit 13 [Guillardia theta CCMP2712]CAJ73103.1 phycoerythrin alpha SU [Guillardia theta]|eukprot:XP_005830240.1 phycoerythrin alpha subunit 13 [Guillardia theta CCMP2712]